MDTCSSIALIECEIQKNISMKICNLKFDLIILVEYNIVYKIYNHLSLVYASFRMPVIHVVAS